MKSLDSKYLDKFGNIDYTFVHILTFVTPVLKAYTAGHICEITTQIRG